MILLDYLNIPEKAKTKQRIPVQTIVDAHGLSHAEEKLLRDHISSIYLVAALNESTINVKTHKDEDMVYEEIHVFDVQLKQTKNLSSLNQKLHTLFPNPTLIIYSNEKSHIFSLALKHMNKYEPNQAVIDEVFLSEPSELIDKTSKKFLDKTNLKNLEANNLKDYYLELINIIYQQRLISIIDDYPDSALDATKVKEALKDLENLQAQLNKVKEEVTSLHTMRSKMENHMKQKEIESRIESIIGNIKEAL